MKNYRICPCHSYDLEGIQTWLENLAMSGLHLSGRAPGFLLFEKGSPCKSRYRLEPNPNTFDRYRKSHADLRYLAGEFGWEFVLRYGAFDIYRTDNADAPELNTDPRVQAMAMDALKQERTHRLLLMALHIVFSLLLYPGVRYFFLSAVLLGFVFVCAVYLAFLLIFLTLAVDLWQIHRTQQKLLLGDALPRKPRRKALAALHISMKSSPAVLLALILVLLGTSMADTSPKAPLSKHPVNPPFITYTDLAEGEEYQYIEPQSIALNGYATWERALAPVNYCWQELGNFSDEPGIARSLTVDYHEIVSEWFAKGLAEDYYAKERARSDKFQDLDAPNLGVDSIRVYSGYNLHVLIQHENIVIDAIVSLNDGADDPAWLRWTEAMAQHLLIAENPDA